MKKTSRFNGNCSGCPIFSLCPSAKYGLGIAAVMFTLPAKAHEVNASTVHHLPDVVQGSLKSVGGFYGKSGRVQNIRLDREALSKDGFKLRIFGREMAVHRHRQFAENHGRTWQGKIDGESTSDVSLTTHDGAVQGVVRRGSQLYEISGREGGGTQVVEIDQELLPGDTHPEYQLDIGNNESQSWGPGLSKSMATSSSGQVLDLMVAYTQASCQRYDDPERGGNADGRCDEIEAKVINAVQSANQAFQNSGFGTQFQSLELNLVQIKPVDYIENGHINEALLHLTHVGGPYSAMDHIHEWRDSAGADLVSLVTEDSDACGTGWSFNGSDQYGFSVVNSACLSSYSLAHEIGHNLGNQHNRENAGSGAAFNYSYGYRYCATDGSGFRTIMSYDCAGKDNINQGIQRIPYFSNPDVYFNGRSTGVESSAANPANNAMTMSKTGAMVANFRRALAVKAPVSPSALSVAPLSEGRMFVQWTDLSGNEVGYHVERSLDGVNWTEVAALPAGTTNYLDAGLLDGLTYHYRVRAYNGLGYSDYTKTAQATWLALEQSGINIASDEMNTVGTVQDSLSATWLNDGFSQTIEEETLSTATGSTSALQHIWRFELKPLNGSKSGRTLVAKIHVKPSAEREGFKFSYSTDNKRFRNIFTVTSSDPGNIQTFRLPPKINGTIYIRVTDTNRRSGKGMLDQIGVDYLVFKSSS